MSRNDCTIIEIMPMSIGWKLLAKLPDRMELTVERGILRLRLISFAKEPRTHHRALAGLQLRRQLGVSTQTPCSSALACVLEHLLSVDARVDEP